MEGLRLCKPNQTQTQSLHRHHSSIPLRQSQSQPQSRSVTETSLQLRAPSEGSLCLLAVQFTLSHYPCPSSSPSSAAPAVASSAPPSFIVVSTPNPAHQHHVNKNTAAPAHPQKTNHNSGQSRSEDGFQYPHRFWFSARFTKLESCDRGCWLLPNHKDVRLGRDYL